MLRSISIDYMQAFRDGEEKGFDYFFKEFYKPLCLFCFKIVNNKEVAEEITQDAFVALWKNREGFRNSAGSIKSYLFTVCKNSCLTWLGKQKRDTLRAKQLAYLSGDSEKNILHDMIRAEFYNEIYVSMETLPLQCRKIFKMYFLQGKNAEQIALELNLAISTVRSQKARGLMLIRKRISLPAFLILLSLI